MKNKMSEQEREELYRRYNKIMPDSITNDNVKEAGRINNKLCETEFNNYLDAIANNDPILVKQYRGTRR